MSNPLTMTGHDDDKTLTSLDESGGGGGGGPAEGAADVLGGAGGAGMAAGPARRKKMSRSSMLLVGTIAVAGAAIGGMRYLAGGPRSSLAAAVKIEYDVEKAKGVSSDHQKVLAELATTQAAQVPPSQVQRNPFMMAGALVIQGPSETTPTPTGKSPKEKEEEERQRLAEERRRNIETEFKELDLHSVMGGSTPVARISGQTVRVGDKVGQYFKVLAIEGRTVTLQADGASFALGMSQGATAPGRPSGQAKPR